MNQDNGNNGGSYENTEDDEKEGEANHTHKVICDCGTRAVFSFFEIVVLTAIGVGLTFMIAVVCGQGRDLFPKHKKIREKKEKLRQEQAEEIVYKKAE